MMRGIPLYVRCTLNLKNTKPSNKSSLSNLSGALLLSTSASSRNSQIQRIKPQDLCSSSCEYVCARNMSNNSIDLGKSVSIADDDIKTCHPALKIKASDKVSSNDLTSSSSLQKTSNLKNNEMKVSNNREELINLLDNLFGIGKSKAEKAVRSVHWITFPVTADILYQQCNYLEVKRNLPLDRIRKMPWLILVPSDELDKRVSKVRSILNVDYVFALPLTSHSISKLFEIKNIWKIDSIVEPEIRDEGFKNRMSYMTKMLKCSQGDVADMFSVVPQLAITSFKKIRDVITLLLESGVISDDIVADPWIFIHNCDTMQTRLKILNERKIPRIKPWLLRTEEHHFQLYINRCEKEQHLRLGHADIQSFIQETLCCTKAEVDHIMFKVPAIKPATASKLNDMIQFLFSKGYVASDIIKTPRILARSRETVEKRIIELTTMGQGPIGFAVLCLTAKNYQLHLKKIKSTPSGV